MAVTIIGTDQGGTGFQSFALGDMLYGNTDLVKLSGNTTTTRKFLRQTGTGVVSAAPVWDTVTNSDVGLGSVENTALSTWAGTTNVTTLGTIATGTWSATAISPTKGGTGITTYSQGDILYCSASNVLSKLSAGTNGFVLRTNGSGANPAWVGSKVLISTQTASNSATINFTSNIDSTFKLYEIEWDGVKSGSTNNGLQMRISTDGGSTWKSGATDYAYSLYYWATGGTSLTVQQSTGVSSINCAVAVITTTANTAGSGLIRCFNPSDSARFFSIETSSTVNNTSTSLWGSKGVGNYTTAGAVNGFRLLMQSGNIVSGNFRLYGIP